MSACRFYYITDRNAFPGDESSRRQQLLEKIREAARCGVDYIQLREKDLSARELETLAREALQAIRGTAKHSPTSLLINSRCDVALAAGADGVHLRGEDISALDVREIWRRAAGCTPLQVSRGQPVIGISCHSTEEVARAAEDGADFVVFGPIFGKKDTPQVEPTGLQQLREACKSKIPVLALGGITLDNARSCLHARAAGIAAIRLFQENSIPEVISAFRQ